MNAAHVAAGAHRGGNQSRTPRQDALTLLDETGVMVAIADRDLADALRGFRWHDLFWKQRKRVLDAMRFMVLGHGLYRQALQPYVGLTGKALIVPVDRACLRLDPDRLIGELDAQVAAIIADPARLQSTDQLTPLPILGVPGWWPDNTSESFYSNENYFRPGRRKAIARGTLSSHSRSDG